MSAEVTDHDQAQKQAKEQPSEVATEKEDSSSKVAENGEEVKSKSSEKEEEAVTSSTSADQDASESTTCSPLEEKIIRQVEVGCYTKFRSEMEQNVGYAILLQFYFGDRNLPKDKFLQQAVASDDDGCVLEFLLLY